MKKRKDTASTKTEKGTPLIADMLAAPERPNTSEGAALLVDPESVEQDGGGDKELAQKAQAQSLQETESEAVSAVKKTSTAPLRGLEESWHRAREMVALFKPVPWFVWRLANFVFGQVKPLDRLPEGFVLGLRRLVFAAASDPVLGQGKKVNDVRKALGMLRPDVIAAISVIHAVCRRLSGKQFERIWRPILDDAIIRAQVGYLVGEQQRDFGPGRGMLAGFAGRVGLVITIAEGELEQARGAMELLAAGTSISEVGLRVYDCDPLQVSALTLSAAGCGRDAAFGTVSYASPSSLEIIENDWQLVWLAAFSVTEALRTGGLNRVAPELWQALGFKSQAQREETYEVIRPILRRGHGWNWLM
jgi:hypothetical protein